MTQIFNTTAMKEIVLNPEKGLRMEKGNFVRPKGDSHVYQIIDIKGTEATVKDGHKKLYTVELSSLVKI